MDLSNQAESIKILFTPKINMLSIFSIAAHTKYNLGCINLQQIVRTIETSATDLDLSLGTNG